jgi:hypothetical protein
MSLLKAVIGDLRDKRLWPIALALIAAIAAVPVLLSNSAKPVAVPTNNGVAPPAPGATALPAVNVQSAPSHSRLKGSARDPFAQQTPSATAAGASAPAGSSSRSGGAAPASGSGAGSGTAGSGKAPSTASTTGTTPTTSPSGGDPGQPVRYFFYVTDLAFGRSGTHLRTYRNAPRLTPLPSASNPTVVFLGVRDAGKAAVFMVWSLSSLSGDGTCMPSRAVCSFLRLRPGQHETINAPDSQGTHSTYTLKLATIQVRSTSSLAQAKAANTRESSFGGRMVRGGWPAHEVRGR